MSTYPRIEVNGVAMDDPSGRWGMDPSQVLRVAPGRRATSVTVPGRSGVLWPRSERMEANVFPVTLVVAGESGSSLDLRRGNVEKALDALQFLFNQPSVTVDYFASASDVKRAECRTLSTSVETVGSDGARVTFAMEIPDAFWRGTSTIQMVQSNTNGQSVNGHFALAGLSGGTAPITDLKFIVQGPFTAFQVTDDATQQTVICNTPLPAGKYLTVDCLGQAAAIWNSPTYETIGGVNASASIVNFGVGSNSSWLNVLPLMNGSDPQSRDYRLAWNFPGATAATGWRLTARKAFL